MRMLNYTPAQCKRVIKGAFMCLAEKHQKILSLCVKEGLSIEEAADALNISFPRAYARLQEAMELLDQRIYSRLKLNQHLDAKTH